MRLSLFEACVFNVLFIISNCYRGDPRPINNVLSSNCLIMHILLIANRFFFISVNIWIDMVNIMTYYKTMISLNINEIKTHFSSFLAKVSNGETIIVCKRNVPIAEIKPIAALPDKKRPIGLAGKEYPDFEISDAFFDPLPDDIVAAFNGEDS